MRRIVKPLIIGFGLFLLMGGFLSVSAKDLKMGYFILSPHVIRVEGGKPVGSAVDWFNKYIAPEMSDSITWDNRTLPVPRLLASLESGSLDMAILFAKSAERAAYLFYPEASYLETVSALLVRRDFPYDKIDTISMIKEFRIGYGQGAFIPPPIRNANLNFDLVASSDFYKVNTNKLMAKRIDAIFDPQDIVLEYTARINNIGDQTKIVNLPGGMIGSYTVFSRKTTDQSIVKQYEDALKKANTVMPYARFVKQWNDPGQ